MSASFESGVQKYVKGYAVVETSFPVDNKGVTYAACKYCRFFSRRSGRCNLTDEIVFTPDSFVGTQCPLEIKEDIR